MHSSTLKRYVYFTRIIIISFLENYYYSVFLICFQQSKKGHKNTDAEKFHQQYGILSHRQVFIYLIQSSGQMPNYSKSLHSLGHGLLFHFSIDLSVPMKFWLTGDFPAWRVFQNSRWPPRAKIETKTHNFHQKQSRLTHLVMKYIYKGIEYKFYVTI